MKRLSLIGDYKGSGAYPTIIRHLAQALRYENVKVLENWHGEEADITHSALMVQYPPAAPNMRHAFNAIWLVWEFLGGEGVPRSFLKALNNVDLVITATEWGAEQFREVTATPVKVVPFGVDTKEFNAYVRPANWRELLPDQEWITRADRRIVLWVGGTDARHGLDIACKVIDALPDNVHLVAKTGTSYPEVKIKHDRVHIIHQDLPTLASLYRGCDFLLHTARAAGFALPVLEALTTGARVVSTPLPAVMEYATTNVRYAEGGDWEWYEDHPVHADCYPRWFEPDLDGLIEAAKAELANTDKSITSWARYYLLYSWEAVTKQMIGMLEW